MGQVEELRGKFERYLVDKKQKFLDGKCCDGRFAKKSKLNDIVYCTNPHYCQNKGRITGGDGRINYCTLLTR